MGRAISLAELQSHQPMLSGAGPFASSPTDFCAVAGEPLDPQENGKIMLPKFGDAMGNQAAYLGYVGTPGAANAIAPACSDIPIQKGPAGYPGMKSSPHQRPPWAGNPALQTWQEDPFS